MKLFLIIPGNLPRKSNNRRKAKGGKWIKSQEALDYVDAFLFQVMVIRTIRPRPYFLTPVKLTATVYYQSNKSDLSTGLLEDCLQKSSIVKNDRLIEEKHLYRQTDKENPRVEMELQTLEDVMEAVK